MSRSIKLFWWNKTPNFGDAISPLLVSRLSGCPVEWAEPSKADIFAVGRIMFQIRVGALNQNRKRPPLVWGSGTMSPISTDFIEKADIRLVRGPFTATLLGLNSTEFGDPGLLACDLLDDRPENNSKVGVVLHHSQVQNQKFRQLIEAIDNAVLIDPRDEPLDVVKRIAECKFVLSSSLHGLIVADAFGVPNTWIIPDGIHREARLKFFDYFASVGRLMGSPIQFNQIKDFIEGNKFTEFTWEEGVSQRQADLRKNFPIEALQASPVEI